MTPARKPYITYRERRYKDQERQLEATFGEGDCIPVVDTEEEEPMAGVVEEDREMG